jgi:hypothetical protein
MVDLELSGAPDTSPALLDGESRDVSHSVREREKATAFAALDQRRPMLEAFADQRWT